jgi:hypothetical protein
MVAATAFAGGRLHLLSAQRLQILHGLAVGLRLVCTNAPTNSEGVHNVHNMHSAEPPGDRLQAGEVVTRLVRKRSGGSVTSLPQSRDG